MIDSVNECKKTVGFTVRVSERVWFGGQSGNVRNRGNAIAIESDQFHNSHIRHCLVDSRHGPRALDLCASSST